MKRGKIRVFTSAAFNYLPKLRLLCESIRKFHPEFEIYWAIADKIPDWASFEKEPIDGIVRIEDLGIENWQQWAFGLNLIELSTAIKPFAAKYLLDLPGTKGVFYFDPDMVLFSRLDDMVDELKRSSILLTPHQLMPETELEAIIDNELPSLAKGIYNLGYFGVTNDEEGRKFLQWWGNRLLRFCHADLERNLWTDQKWINFVPVYFDHVGILKSDRFNVAAWNITKRKIEEISKENYIVNGEPLGFYHFSGFDSGAHKIMATRYAGHNPAVVKLISWYEKQTILRSDAKFGSLPWGFGQFDNGVSISDVHRKIYRERRDLQKMYPSPFLAGERGDDTFFSWFNIFAPREYPKLLGVSEAVESTNSSSYQDDEMFDNQIGLTAKEFLEARRQIRSLNRKLRQVDQAAKENLLTIIGLLRQKNPINAMSKIKQLINWFSALFYERRLERGLIAKSGLFDCNWYLASYPEAMNWPDPIIHYLQVGYVEGCNPNPLFDSTWYLEKNPDVASAGDNPLIHYIKFGSIEGRSAGPYVPTGVSVAGLLANTELARRVLLKPYPSLDDYSKKPNTEFLAKQRIAIVIHAFYPDIFSGMLPYFDSLNLDFKLFVTTSMPSTRSITAFLQSKNYKYEVIEVENRGRDIAPFLKVISKLDDEGYEYVLKVHTKKSPHYVAGNKWRDQLFRSLLPALQIYKAVDVFHRYPNIGFIGPAEYMIPMSRHWADNERLVRSLAAKMGKNDLKLNEEHFVAGTMFFVRRSALQPLVNLNIRTEDFESEQGQLDGTLSHAIERLFVLSANIAGFKALQIDMNEDWAHNVKPNN